MTPIDHAPETPPPGCAAVRAHWHLLLDDDPARAAQMDRAALDNHVAGCADCRSWTAAAQKLREGLALRRPLAPPPALADRVFAAVVRDRRRTFRRRTV